MASKLLSLDAIQTSAAALVDAVGSIYEKSPWIVERAFAAAPFASLTALAAAMVAVVDAATEEEQLALLRAHPDLAGKAALAGELTDESTEEQAQAGLGSLTPAEMERFTALNGAYRDKFGFPFILAVRGATKHVILGAFDARLANARGAELAACIAQVHKIAWMRLRLLVAHAPTGKLTCHVLDTARGCPAAAMAVTLRRQTSDAWEVVGRWMTNSDGRLPNGPALEGAALVDGVYEWTFGVGDYFAIAGVPTAGTPFLKEVPIRFGIDNPETHYHVPLLASPWSFSTYRGS